MIQLPTREQILEHLIFIPETGEFIWKLRRRPTNLTGRALNSWRMFNKSLAGTVAGSFGDTHIQISLFGHHFMAHRLAWVVLTGRPPKEEIDHVNRNGFDNRACNLREATRAQNKQNTRGYTRSGLPKGVRRSGRRKFRAMIKPPNSQTEMYLGTFDSAADASAAYRAAALKHFGEFARFD